METDRLRTMSSILGPGINAFSWGRGCKGKLKNKEREVFASFSSTVAPVVQASSFGILAEDCRRFASASSGRRGTGPSFTTTSGMPSLRVQRTCSKQQLHLVPVGPRRKNWKLSSLVKTSSSSSRGSVSGGSHVALGLVAGVMGMGGNATVGGRIVAHSCRLGITSNCIVTFFSRLRGGYCENVSGQWTCSNCFAERFWPVRMKCCRCGETRNNDSAPWNAKKGKGPKGPLGRAPPKGQSSVPPTTSNQSATCGASA